MAGTLYVCGTPIGNMEDMTFRGVKTLGEVDIIAAEDTRHTLKILNHYEISTKVTSYHEHNKKEKGNVLISMLQDGKNIALVSDAGMPCISDPGYDLVKLCYENDIQVTTVPTATAVVSGLILSGLDSRRYIFEGFLPRDKKDRREKIDSFQKETRTIVMYEAPHHIKQTLKELSAVMGGRQVVVMRELTKKFEERLGGTCEELLSHFEVNEPRGEMVVVLEGISEDIVKQEIIDEWEKMSVVEHFEMYVGQGLSDKDAMKKVAKDRGIGKRDVYGEVKG